MVAADKKQGADTPLHNPVFPNGERVQKIMHQSCFGGKKKL
ncbi:MAG: hypothetical protein ACLTWR_03635 [Agathobaculum desmolans]